LVTHVGRVFGGHMPSLPLATDASDHPHVFARAFNTFDLAELDRVYEHDGVLVPSPGNPVTGYERRAANAELLSLGKPIVVRPKHVYVCDEIALLIVDWEIPGAGVAGTATDVARRGADGYWRYVIDNPQPVEQ
jgi:ketosteroid isomerase-like protein